MGKKGSKQTFEQIEARISKIRGVKRGPSKNRKSTTQIVADLVAIWDDRYLFDRVVYTTSKQKIEIGCKIHGYFFKNVHDFKNGYGCPQCSVVKGVAFPIDQQMVNLQSILPNMDFSKFVYTKALTKSIVICPKHGEYSISPNTIRNLHKFGTNGCRRCGLDSALSKRIASGKCRDTSVINEYKVYRQVVRRITNQTYAGHKTTLGIRNRQNHLDHMYSIADGWHNKVDPKILGHICNLRIIDGIENQKKNHTSSISLTELLQRYKEQNNGT